MLKPLTFVARHSNNLPFSPFDYHSSPASPVAFDASPDSDILRKGSS